MESDRWLSVAQIAAHIGVSTDVVYKWIKEKRLPAHRVGKLWKFQSSEVDKWIKSGGSTIQGNESKKSIHSKNKA